MKGKKNIIGIILIDSTPIELNMKNVRFVAQCVIIIIITFFFFFLFRMSMRD